MQLSLALFCIRIINGNRKSLLLATVVTTPLKGFGGPQSDGEALACDCSRRSRRLHLAVRICHEQRTASLRRDADVTHRTPEDQHAVFRFTTYLHH